MKRVERIIYKLLLCHLLLLLVVQLLLRINDVNYYMNRTFFYEGITKQVHVKTIETLINEWK